MVLFQSTTKNYNVRAGIGECFFCLALCPEKNDFWFGKIIFVKLEGDMLEFPFLRRL